MVRRPAEPARTCRRRRRQARRVHARSVTAIRSTKKREGLHAPSMWAIPSLLATAIRTIHAKCARTTKPRQDQTPVHLCAAQRSSAARTRRMTGGQSTPWKADCERVFQDQAFRAKADRPGPTTFWWFGSTAGCGHSSARCNAPPRWYPSPPGRHPRCRQRVDPERSVSSADRYMGPSATAGMTE